MEAIAKKFYDYAVDIANNSTYIVIAVLIIAILIIGLSLALSEDARKSAKKWIPWAIVGTIVALSPVTIANAIVANAAF